MDPYRNIESDIKSALNYMADAYEIHSECFEIRTLELPMKQILKHADYSAWGEWDEGDLGELEGDDLESELVHFRGQDWANMAFDWLHGDGIPAIVIVESRNGSDIADGRGRVSMAVGLDIKKLPVVILETTKRRGNGVVCVLRDANGNPILKRL